METTQMYPIRELITYVAYTFYSPQIRFREN